jgi:hypothetical protein
MPKDDRLGERMAKDKPDTLAAAPEAARAEAPGTEHVVERPDRFPIPVEEFVLTHNRGREIETRGAFAFYARQRGWAQATTDVWVSRYEEFQQSPLQ